MAGNANQVPVMLFWGGEIVRHGDHKSADYSDLPKSVCFLSRSSSHDELVAAVHTAMNTSEDNTKLTLFGRYPSTIPGVQVVYVPFPLVNNQSWQWFLEATLLFQPVHVYIVAEKKETTDDRSLGKRPRSAQEELVTHSCIGRVGSSGCANEHTLNCEEDDGRVKKIRRFCQGELLSKQNTSKVTSSYREDECALNGGNDATARDGVVTTNPTPTATQAAAPATYTSAVTKPSFTAAPTAADAQAAADATDAVGATNPSSPATPVAAAFDFMVAGREDQTTRRLNPLPIPAPVFATAARAVVATAALGELEKKKWWTDILNSLTPQNSKRVLEQLKDANIDNAKSLADFTRIAYDKAMRDPPFREMLVDICIELNCILPGFTVDGKDLNFASCLSDCCQKELQGGKEGFKRADDQRCRGWKIFNRGNAKLIGELYMKKLLDEGIVHSCIKKILWEYENPDEAEIEALCDLMYRVGKSMDSLGVEEQQRKDMDMYFDEMSKLSEHPDLSSGLKRMLVRLVDLRKNKWRDNTADITLKISLKYSKRTFPLILKYGDTIYHLKEMIKAKKGFLVCKQMLYYSGMLLAGNNTLAHYNLQNNCTLNLYP